MKKGTGINKTTVYHNLALGRILRYLSSLLFSLWAGFWQVPEPSQATGMALARCILGKFLGVVCHCFYLPLDVPTFAARYLHVPSTPALLVAKGGTLDENGPIILPKWRLFYAI
jgi:hypothetical protein